MTTDATIAAADAKGAEGAAVRKALSTAPRPPRAGAFTATMAFGWRGMLKVKHVPEQLVDVTITPVLFLLMFTYLFGGAVSGSTSEYLDYILPGVLVMAVLFTTVYSGISINTDLTKGVVDRFRSLPIWGPSPLLGALLGDAVRYVVAGAVILVLGLALGYRPAGSVLEVLAAVGLVVLLCFAMSWVFTALGLVLRSPNAVMNVGFMSMFPVTFVSNVFVEPSTLPRWVESFVDVNPVSHLVTATRSLMAGSPDGTALLVVLVTAAVLTAVFAPLTGHLYRTRS